MPSLYLLSVQFSSVAQLCPTLCDPMICSMPGLPVHHQLPEFTQTHVHRVSDAIQTSHPPSSSSPPAPHRSQHQSLFQWVNSSHEVAKVLEFQLHQQLHKVNTLIIFILEMENQASKGRSNHSRSYSCTLSAVESNLGRTDSRSQVWFPPKICLIPGRKDTTWLHCRRYHNDT